jgi:hypothetical protein
MEIGQQIKDMPRRQGMPFLTPKFVTGGGGACPGPPSTHGPMAPLLLGGPGAWPPPPPPVTNVGVRNGIPCLLGISLICCPISIIWHFGKKFYNVILMALDIYRVPCIYQIRIGTDMYRVPCTYPIWYIQGTMYVSVPVWIGYVQTLNIYIHNVLFICL